MVDTHAHLGLCEPQDAELVAAARDAGVGRILTVGLDEDSNAQAVTTASSQAEVFACVGRHPNAATGYDAAAESAIAELATRAEVLAIGETGLDYYRQGASKDDQRKAFSSQIELARDLGLPLVVHLRDEADGSAMGEAFELLAARGEGLNIVLHCFSGSAERAVEAARHGWYCSFAGNVTYPSARDLRDAARAVPDALLLAETDSPFLAPQPVRGRPNQPAHVVEVARILAAERDVEYEELERLVERNARTVFGW